VIEAGPCPVTQVKTVETDGYAAVQLGFGGRKDKHATRAEKGHAARAGLDLTPRVLREFRVAQDASFEPGQVVTLEGFEAGDRVKVTGTAKGRGFQGVVKRHGFRGRPGSHGHPRSRNPGSMGPGTDPSRTIKGKKLPGQMGAGPCTVKNLRVEKVDAERNLLYVRGAVPGAPNGIVFVRKA
jgi:large subunit ribosomal protein L3